MGNFILAMAIANNPDYSPHPWTYFVIYAFFAIAGTLYNVFAIRKTMWLYTFGCKCSTVCNWKLKQKLIWYEMM